MLQHLQHLHCPINVYGYIMLSAAIHVLKENAYVRCGSFHTVPGLFVSDEMLELAWAAQKPPALRSKHVGNCSAAFASFDDFSPLAPPQKTLASACKLMQSV